jgi:hypothetical protein
MRDACIYHELKGQFFNAGGALPCMCCTACLAAYEALQRLKAWNRATAQGAKPNR